MTVPREYDHFNEEYLNLCEFNVSLIRKINHLKMEQNTTPFKKDEVTTCIRKLNTGESSSEFGLFAEQLKAVGEVILTMLFDTLHEILRSSDISACFNDGILIPVPKSGNNLKLMDNY